MSIKEEIKEIANHQPHYMEKCTWEEVKNIIKIILGISNRKFVKDLDIQWCVYCIQNTLNRIADIATGDNLYEATKFVHDLLGFYIEKGTVLEEYEIVSNFQKVKKELKIMIF
jgi:hypothetical protein